MTPLRVMICDDEPLALERLEDLLACCSGVTFAGAVISGAALIEALASTRVDVVLLDIEMPRMDGFDVADAMSKMEWSAERPHPMIIFATARPKFAVAAFDTLAIDFIAKPVRLGRLERALDRARRFTAQIEAHRRLEELASHVHRAKTAYAEKNDGDHLWLRKGQGAVRVDVDEVEWLGAERECIRFHTATDSYLERGSLQEAAIALEPFGFLRVHRSAVVNTRRIGAMEKGRWGRLTLNLLSGTKLPVGKKFRESVLALTKRQLSGPA